MSTISKTIADAVIAGHYPDDHPRKIIRYTNAWGGDSYGLTCEGDNPDTYRASEFVINPTVYWEAPTTPAPESEGEPESLLAVLMRRDGLSRVDAMELIEEAREAVREGANPEEILHDDFGLEPDYIFDLIDGF